MVVWNEREGGAVTESRLFGETEGRIVCESALLKNWPRLQRIKLQVVESSSQYGDAQAMQVFPKLVKILAGTDAAVDADFRSAFSDSGHHGLPIGSPDVVIGISDPDFSTG